MLKGFSRGPQFGDDDTHDAFTRRRVAAQESIRYPYQVAPGCAVELTRGTVHEGGEVTEDDMSRSELVQLVAKGVVLEANPAQLVALKCPTDARYRVAPGRSLTSLQGMLTPGAEVRPEYIHADPKVARASLDRLVAAGLVVDAKAKQSSAPRFRVAPRRSVMSLEGTLSPGDEVRAELLHTNRRIAESMLGQLRQTRVVVDALDTQAPTPPEAA